MRIGAVVIACGATALLGCSLFVSLDDLNDGPSDASTDATDALINGDAILPSDSSTDGFTNDGQVVSGYAAAVLADKPLAYYHFDEMVGPLAHDSSGNGNDAVFIGTETLGVAGAFSGSSTAAHLDGQSYVRIEGSSSLDASPTSFDFVGLHPYSYEAWVSFDSQPVHDTNEFTFFSKEDNISGDIFTGLDFYTNPTFTFQREDDRDASSSQLQIGSPTTATHVWYYVVGVYDGGSITMYVNALQISAQPSTTVVPMTKASFLLGSEAEPYENGFIGVFDETAIYDHALSASQIAAHYAAATK